jgi:hypothetical protein
MPVYFLLTLKFLIMIKKLTPAVMAIAQSGPQIFITTPTHDFGNIKQGVPATYDFEVKNTGNQPLIIQDVKPSCGCTTPEWPKTPILPGKTAMIKVSYDAASPGPFNKSIFVKSNATNVEKGDRYELRIKGTVQGS